MCGILGSIPSTESHFFKDALSLLSHRGPDGEKTYHIDNKLSFGHTRLSVIDTSDDASQPFRYEHLTIIINGEIYNYKEIKKELITLGYKFRTQSDTEVAVASYLHWGASCLKRFNGMWAMAIWDEQKEELFLCRDRFGKKPLFYTEQKDKFIFGSEMKALLPFLDKTELADDFTWLVTNQIFYESTDKCLIKGIKRFPAAHYGIYKNNQLKLHRYWDTFNELSDVPKTYELQCEQFAFLFKDACRLRLRSDVAVATSLSGGLDSGAIASVVKFLSKNSTNAIDYEAFTAFMPNSSSDESGFAKSLCEQNNIHLNLTQILPQQALENIYKDYYYFEEIYYTPPYPMSENYKSMKEKGVKVSLDGHGADELFCGYRNFMFLSFLDCGLNYKKIKEITKTYNETYSYNFSQHYDKRTPLLSYLKTQLWYRFLPHYLKNNRISEELQKEMIKKMGYLNYGLYVLFHLSTLPTLLRNFDRYAMRHGVEVRMPFLDYRVVTFCLSLPWHSKIRNGFTKAIIRDALKDCIPQNIRERKSKQAFQAPIEHWMRNEWKEVMSDLIVSQEFKSSKLVNSKLIEHNFFKKRNDLSYFDAENLFKLMSPFFWEQGFLKKKFEDIL